MNIIKVKNYDEMSLKAAECLIKKVRQNPKITLGLATGGTPVGLYDNLVQDHQINDTSYAHVTTFNLDEYVGISGDAPSSYRYFMNDHLFNHINIQKSNIFIPIGDTENPEEQCNDYESLLKSCGGIDLQILGIGSNGHIGFNEPGSSFQSETQVIELTSSTREDNARFFNSLEEVPTHAITMGIASIMRSREILLLISGANKRDALSRLLQGEISEDFPASILKKHPNVTIIADADAIGEMAI